ncbi:hypothetical protein [Tsuneonella sp. HG222]
MIRAIFALAALPLALAACSNEPDPAASDTVQDAEDARVEENSGLSPAVNEQNAVETTAVPELEAFATDRTPGIPGAVVTCSFKLGTNTLLITGLEPQANARGKGIVQVGGEERILTGTAALGADGMRAGPTMTDGEYTVVVERESKTGAAAAGVPATIVSRYNMANERRYGPGLWTCSS